MLLLFNTLPLPTKKNKERISPTWEKIMCLNSYSSLCLALTLPPLSLFYLEYTLWMYDSYDWNIHAAIYYHIRNCMSMLFLYLEIPNSCSNMRAGEKANDLDPLEVVSFIDWACFWVDHVIVSIRFLCLYITLRDPWNYMFMNPCTICMCTQIMGSSILTIE